MRYLIFIIFVCAFINNYSQNLVPNSSFEIYSTCPNTGGQIALALPWFNPNNASPDYYNQCSGIMNVPNTPLGYQNARNGVAFAGIFVFQNNPSDTTNKREYIECTLINSLMPGKKYCLEFYLSSLNLNGSSQ